ncbi:MAG: L-seryl-tRNA(Sec) selenium transferase, partial [Dehalococcoidia bacterium]
YIADYEAAITEDTAALLRVHPSNFRVLGFTQAPTLEEMVELGQRHNILVLHDIGSGCLLDTSQFDLAPEPTPQASVAAGVDLVFFSGDKLLGGPQSGMVVGRKDLVSALRRHPMARALRIDKLTLAALSATLVHYVKEEALSQVPVWRMISMALEDIEARASSWAKGVGEVGRVIEGRSTIGGGSLPGETLPTKLLAVAPPGDRGIDELARRLRLGDPPVMGRIDEDTLLLDPRTVLPEQDEALVPALQRALAPDPM